MMQPNFGILLWVLLISLFIGAISRIIAGGLQLKKDDKYNSTDIVLGIIELVILGYVLVG